MLTKTQKHQKRPPKLSKNKMFVFGLLSTSDDWLSDLSDERWLKCKNELLSHQKIKCSFTDGLPEDCQKTPEDCQKTTRRPAEDMQNTTRVWQKTSRRQAEDYQKSSRRPAEDCQKTTRRLPEDCQKTTRPSAERSEQKTLTKMQKNEKGPLSHWKIKCSFLDYIQLLMISWAIWAKNVNRNAKNEKGP